MNEKKISDIIEEVFQNIKENESLDVKDLLLIKNSSKKSIYIAIKILKEDYELIYVSATTCTLTPNGEKYEHVKSYISSINTKKRDWFKIIPIILTIIFGSSTTYFSIRDYHLKNNYQSLIKVNDSLNNEVSACKNRLLSQKKQINIMKSNFRLSEKSEPKVIVKSND